MSAIVTLDIFSGASNPTWELQDREIGQLRNSIDRLQERSFLKPPVVHGGLGYMGFRIDSAYERLERVIVVSGGIVDLERFVPSRVDRNREIEHFLLDTGRRVLKPNIIDHVERRLQSAGVKADLDAHILAPVPYDPGKWNNDPYIQDVPWPR